MSGITNWVTCRSKIVPLSCSVYAFLSNHMPDPVVPAPPRSRRRVAVPWGHPQPFIIAVPSAPPRELTRVASNPPFVLLKSDNIAIVMSAADMTWIPMSYNNCAWGRVYFIAVRILRSAPWQRTRLSSRPVPNICMVESLRDCGVRNLIIKLETALVLVNILVSTPMTRISSGENKRTIGRPKVN